MPVRAVRDHDEPAANASIHAHQKPVRDPYAAGPHLYAQPTGYGALHDPLLELPDAHRPRHPRGRRSHGGVPAEHQGTWEAADGPMTMSDWTRARRRWEATHDPPRPRRGGPPVAQTDQGPEPLTIHDVAEEPPCAS
jgi:hypothetical protein